MKKNYIIAILVVLLMLSTVYNFFKRAEADRYLKLAERNAAEASAQLHLAEKQKEIAEANAMEALKQRDIAMKAIQDCSGKKK